MSRVITTTCIVGIEHEGHVYIGGDSAGVKGLSIQTRRDEKVFKNEDFVMGFTSSFRMGQVLRYAFVPPEHSPRKDDMEYLVTDFIDAVREAYKESGFMSKDEESNSAESGGTFLLGYKGNLYIVDDDFQVGQTHDGYAAVGCGSDLALGSLYTSSFSDPVERMEVALKAAAHFSAGVRGPFNYVSTKHDGYINGKR